MSHKYAYRVQSRTRMGALTLLCGLLLACSPAVDIETNDTFPSSIPEIAPVGPTETARITPVPIAGGDKWALWTGGPHLRGANIYQRRVYPELDGSDFMGPGPVGPPFIQEDFNRLAALGANYVNISHPGIFSETAPYALDVSIQDNLDALLGMAAQADLFAVISFRTGPGRAEFSVCCLEEAGDWYDERYLNDDVWREEGPQEAWAAMWRHTAERYRDNPIIVGYDLMVEPNANEVLTGDWLDPNEFYGQYSGTLADWNQLFPRIIHAVRQVDSATPILVGGMGYSGIDWLPYLEPVTDQHTIYVVHQYAPINYTHQGSEAPECRYPGECDTDWDGEAEHLDRAWIARLLAPISDFVTAYHRPVAVNELGVIRWVPGGAEFMEDQIGFLEQIGLNHALWAWEPAWGPWVEEVDDFNFRHGPDPKNHSEISSELMDVIVSWWGRNAVRPSILAE